MLGGSHVSIPGFGRNRILFFVHQSPIVEYALSVHLEIGDIGVPVGDISPPATPGVLIHTGKSESRRKQNGCRFSVGAECFAVQIQLRIVFTWPPAR
jgi:hypothetical protein